ncbi:MAG: hypothetical protein ACJAVV_001063 [Alphaproteobacteria bacterium]
MTDLLQQKDVTKLSQSLYFELVFERFPKGYLRAVPECFI